MDLREGGLHRVCQANAGTRFRIGCNEAFPDACGAAVFSLHGLSGFIEHDAAIIIKPARRGRDNNIGVERGFPHHALSTDGAHVRFR